MAAFHVFATRDLTRVPRTAFQQLSLNCLRALRYLLRPNTLVVLGPPIRLSASVHTLGPTTLQRMLTCWHEHLKCHIM